MFSPKTKGVFQQIRSFLVRGVLFALPIAVTVFVTNFALGMVDSYLGAPTDAIVRLILPDSVTAAGGLFPYGHIPGMSMILLILVLIILGAVASWKVGNQGLRLIDLLALKIPLLGGIYASTRKIVDSFGSSERFQRVVMLNVFGSNVRALAFVTGETVDSATGRKTLWVFLPQLPNPTSGLLLNVPEDETTATDITPQDAFKMLMSLGTLMPAQMPLDIPPKADR